MDQISDIGLFARVVATGNLSAAGRDLGLSAAAISKRLMRLEARLGVQLLKRTTRGASPTDEGAVFYERCRSILAQIEEAEAEVGGQDTDASGVLKVVAPIAFGRMHIAPQLPEFLARYPKVQVDLRLSALTVDFVADQCDVWIRIGEPEDSRLVARRLAPTWRIVCASPEYLARHGEPQTAEDLKHHDCLIIDLPNTRPDLWHFAGPNGPETVRVNGSVRSNDGEVITRCAVAGVGIAVKATWDVSALIASGELRQILHEYQTPATNIYALSLHNRHRAARVRAFTDFLTERFGPMQNLDPPNVRSARPA